MSKRAVILFNLGGPDSPKAVRPFLFNLFNDKAIISVPGWIRWAIATLISARRATIARDIYAKIGGRSPILELTQAQAAALEKELAGGDGEEVRVFIAMRYWH
ncbi:MAG: ferrochelatase, partial [Rhodospirillales bacterium]|nr:ferrochelatase [Rhodospirillales bacterium]